jgi:hypothetical protein
MTTKLAAATDLQARLTRILDTVERQFGSLTDAQLRTKPANGGWSIVECLQHLNLAERYYIRQLQHKVDKLGLVQHNPEDQTLESGWVGRLLLSIVDPKSKRKFPAPGVVQPRAPSDLDPTAVIAQFVELQTLLRSLLDKAVYLDWNRDKTATLFGSWLKIRVGDMLVMLVAHTERHLAQAMRVKAELSL